MVNNKENLEIITAIKTGNNQSALNKLYKNSLPKIVKFITMNNGDEEEAKDIFQDAVIALFNTIKLNRYDETKDVNAFLFFVSKNLWINRIKRKNKQLSINLKETELPFEEESPLAVIITDEKKEAISNLMDKVGSQCKELLKYTLYEKLSMKEIAIKMDFSGENVAKTAHYRCKQKLMALVANNKTLHTLFR